MNFVVSSNRIDIVDRLSAIIATLFTAVPIFTGVDITPTPTVGEPFFIECAAEGTPTPNTAWVKDGVPLKESEVHNSAWLSISIHNFEHWYR